MLNNIKEYLRVDRTGFDFDVLSTIKGQALFRRTSGDKWVITTRSYGDRDFWTIIDRLKLDRKRVIFARSNQRKVEEIRRLGIEVFYDSNPSVRAMLPGVVRLV